jgi:hypothetical protein
MALFPLGPSGGDIGPASRVSPYAFESAPLEGVFVYSGPVNAMQRLGVHEAPTAPAEE